MARMTLRTLEVVSTLMEAPEGELYGLQIMRRAGLASGLVYPILAQMEAAGWVTSWQEDIDPHAEERPPRRYYRLTDAGTRAAKAAMARLPRFPAESKTS